MADEQIENVENNKPEKAVALAQPVAPPAVLSGAEKLLDGTTHVGVAVQVTSDGKPSTLMITDITQIGKGYPIYITKPVRIKGANLKTFLANKGAVMPEKLQKLIEDTSISCEAFYFAGSTGADNKTTASILLMMFALQFQDGLITTLTGDADIGGLFDIQGASVRLFKCPEGSYKILQNYTAELLAE